MYEQTLAQALWLSFRDTAREIIIYTPLVLGGLIVFACGWVLAGYAGQFIEWLGKRWKIDDKLGHLYFGDQFFAIASAGVGVTSALAATIRWGLIIILTVSVAGAVRLPGITIFIRQLLYYVPNVFTAIVILLFGALAADLLAKVCLTMAAIIRPKSSRLLQIVARLSIWIFSIFAAVEQLGVSADLTETITLGLVVMFVMAGGITLGLAGKDYAVSLLDKLNRTWPRE